MIDFDKMFSVYLIEWHKKNMSKYSPREIEAMLDDLYESWASTPDDKLGGASPRGYFAAISDTKRLVEMLCECCRGTGSPSSLLLDEIVGRKDADSLLADIVRRAENAQVTVVAVNLLLEKGYSGIGELVFDWVFDPKIEGELRELAVEVLADNPSAYAERLLEGVKTCDAYGRTLACDVLVNVKDDERIYKLILKLFLDGDNTALYAMYLGRYGNPQAIEILTSHAEDCDYLEYLEIRNAVEMLGGVLDIVRDFEGDKYYDALNGGEDNG